MTGKGPISLDVTKLSGDSNDSRTPTPSPVSLPGTATAVMDALRPEPFDGIHNRSVDILQLQVDIATEARVSAVPVNNVNGLRDRIQAEIKRMTAVAALEGPARLFYMERMPANSKAQLEQFYAALKAEFDERTDLLKVEKAFDRLSDLQQGSMSMHEYTTELMDIFRAIGTQYEHMVTRKMLKGVKDHEVCRIVVMMLELNGTANDLNAATKLLIIGANKGLHVLQQVLPQQLPHQLSEQEKLA